MIPVTDKTKITDFMNGEKTVMSVNPEDWKKLSGLLINLYSDTILACIREYSTNAHDTHVEAGVERPIEVHLPNQFNSTFAVKDYGTGMSKDDLQKVYAMFGASTKDKSNDFNGSMGLGSKSALTYTDAFTVISIKDGTRTIALVGRDEDGNGIMEILGEAATDEPNGTTIEIPSRSGDESKFVSKAYEFYQYWPKGSVLVNGKEPTHFDPEESGYDDVGDGLWMGGGVYNLGSSRLRIIMGNVCYEHSLEHDERLKSRVDLLFYAPNGSVQFSPSRESLLMNKTTTKYVANLATRGYDAYIAMIVDKISNANSLKEALQANRKYQNVLSDGVADYKGIRLKSRFDYRGRRFSIHGDYTESVGFVDTLNVAYNDSVVFVENFGGKGLSRAQKDAIVKYRDNLPDDQKFSTFYFAGTLDPVAQDARRVDWEKIKPMVKSINKASAANKTYDMFYYDDASKTVKRDARVLPDGKMYLYASPVALRGGWDNRFYSMSWLEHMPNTVLVVLAMNRHGKFKSDHPKAKPARKYLREWAEKKVSRLTDAEKEVLAHSEHERAAFGIFYGKTDDKHIDKIAAAMLSYKKKTDAAAAVLDNMCLGSVEDIVKSNMNVRNKHYFATTYPLVNTNWRPSVGRLAAEHEIKYINMIYGENND